MGSKDEKKPLLGQKKAPEETVILQKDDFYETGAGKRAVSDETRELTDVQEVKGDRKRRRSIFKPREKRPNFVLSVILTIIQLAFVVGIVAIVAGFGSVIGVANAYLETTPELDTQKIENQDLSSYIYDQSGNLLATYTGAENRDWVSLEDVPRDLGNAVIAVEDIRFYDHNGVDFRRLVGAFASNLSSSKVEGGSTITQQLVKNRLLTNERSYKRKLQEAYLAMQLEEKYTKDEILEWYLNTIPLGGTVYGVKTAAKDYFGKELSQLNLKEMVCIAAITQSTTRFNPRRATYAYPENLPYLIDRMNIITERMLWADMITQEQYDETYIPTDVYLDPSSVTDEDGTKHLYLRDGFLDEWKAEMNILEESPANSLYKYPHFVEYVIHQVQTFMLRDQGLEDTAENRSRVELEMRQGGYKIYATIDAGMQETVQNTLAEWDSYPAFAYGVEKTVKSTDGAGNPIEIIQPQAAAVVVDNRDELGYDGFLRVIVGSRTAPESALTFNRAYMGSMQIGSSIKPLGVYGPAFSEGYGTASSVSNNQEPITGWTVTKSDPGYPQTSKGSPGPVSLRKAIVSSLNIAAARTLADYVHVDKAAQYLQALGVDPDHIDRTLVGIALGASPITPIEVAGGYATIARGGEYVEPISFTRVEDSNGNIVINAVEQRERRQVFSQATCWMLTDALEDAVDHGTGTNAKISGMTTAGKTGTVVDNKGTFFAGYTPYFTSSLWIGHDNFKPFASGSGGGVAAPVWRTYMSAIHEGMTDKPILDYTAEEAGLVEVSLCSSSNLLPGSGCDTNYDYIAAKDVPQERCNGRHSSSDFLTEGYQFCTETHQLATEFCPSTYTGMPYGSEDSPYGEYGSDMRTGDASQYCQVHTGPQASASADATTSPGAIITAAPVDTPAPATQAPPPVHTAQPTIVPTPVPQEPSTPIIDIPSIIPTLPPDEETE